VCFLRGPHHQHRVHPHRQCSVRRPSRGPHHLQQWQERTAPGAPAAAAALANQCSSPQGAPTTFSYTGAAQSYTADAQCLLLQVQAWGGGAGGKTGTGGSGAYMRANVAVSGGPDPHSHCRRGRHVRPQCRHAGRLRGRRRGRVVGLWWRLGRRPLCGPARGGHGRGHCRGGRQRRRVQYLGGGRGGHAYRRRRHGAAPPATLAAGPRSLRVARQALPPPQTASPAPCTRAPATATGCAGCGSGGGGYYGGGSACSYTGGSGGGGGGSSGRALQPEPRACVRACPTLRAPLALPSPTTPARATSWAGARAPGARTGCGDHLRGLHRGVRVLPAGLVLCGVGVRQRMHRVCAGLLHALPRRVAPQCALGAPRARMARWRGPRRLGAHRLCRRRVHQCERGHEWVHRVRRGQLQHSGGRGRVHRACRGRVQHSDGGVGGCGVHRLSRGRVLCGDHRHGRVHRLRRGHLPRAAATGAATCTACAAGKYGAVAGAPTSTVCTACAMGTYDAAAVGTGLRCAVHGRYVRRGGRSLHVGGVHRVLGGRVQRPGLGRVRLHGVRRGRVQRGGHRHLGLHRLRRGHLREPPGRHRRGGLHHVRRGLLRQRGRHRPPARRARSAWARSPPRAHPRWTRRAWAPSWW
jgi:hypothetical protein